MNYRKLFAILTFFQVLFNSDNIFAQNTFLKTNIGYGVWESFHGGIDLQLNNFSFGLDVGTSFNAMPFDNKYFSVTIDNTCYWGRVNKMNLKSWYCNARLIYWDLSEPDARWRVMQICPSIGKEINFTKELGINFDFGPAIVLHANREDKSDVKVGWIYPVYPECRIEFFYRFKE